MQKSVLYTLFLLLWTGVVAEAVAAADPEPDQHENCNEWAQRGECDDNPGYMLKSCATACHRVATEATKDAQEVNKFDTFFDLSARDISGQDVSFQDYKGQVTLVANVASECGYTDSHYQSLTKLWSEVAPTKKVNILAFPCNQFGKQEPGSSADILNFVQEEYGVEFTMMEKVKVNGPDAHIVYKWLKSKAGGPARISWNFATYFVVGPDGQVEAFSGVEPYKLKEKLLGLLPGGDEL